MLLQPILELEAYCKLTLSKCNHFQHIVTIWQSYFTGNLHDMWNKKKTAKVQQGGLYLEYPIIYENKIQLF